MSLEEHAESPAYASQSPESSPGLERVHSVILHAVQTLVVHSSARLKEEGGCEVNASFSLPKT